MKYIPDCQITCVVHDKNLVIQQVGIAGNLYNVQDVVNWINNGTNTFYTLENGVRANVIAKKHPTSGRWFLTTDPDGYNENNLDFLPKCK